MEILSTIIPIFIIIFLGVFARLRGFISTDFVNQANRLVYYIAIPAMIFSAISKASLKTEVNLVVISATLVSILLIIGVSWAAALALKIPRTSRGSFIHCSFHGNLGYIGLAVAFYYLGHSGFVRAAIIVGFVMIVQNVLAVVILQVHSRINQDHFRLFDTLKAGLTNPVILSALAGIFFSLMDLTLPVILDRSLDILKGMALPMALLIIGASLSFEKMKHDFVIVLASTGLKTMATPAIGLALFKLLGISPENYLPGLIILAAPTATLTYIMAREMGGDPDLSVAAISICTILSGVTYGIWLSLG
jgi:predicted permease